MLSCSAKVDGCVICNNAKVLEKAVLKDCDVAGEYVVERESKSTRVYKFLQIRIKKLNMHYLGQVKGEKLVAFREAIN